MACWKLQKYYNISRNYALHLFCRNFKGFFFPAGNIINLRKNSNSTFVLHATIQYWHWSDPRNSVSPFQKTYPTASGLHFQFSSWENTDKRTADPRCKKIVAEEAIHVKFNVTQNPKVKVAFCQRKAERKMDRNAVKTRWWGKNGAVRKLLLLTITQGFPKDIQGF